MEKSNRLSDIWSDMDREKGDLIERSEAYARWTIPNICLPDNANQTNDEQDKGCVDIGSQVVNHLANRVVDLLFPVNRPFFTLAMTPETELEISQEMDAEQKGQFMEQVTEATTRLEKIAMRGLDLTHYRPIAVQAAKHMIITGNTLIRKMKNGMRVEYGIKRFGVRRNIDGGVIEIMLYDKKRLDTFTEAEQATIKAPRENLSLKNTDEVELLTYYKRDGKRWVICQEAEGQPVGGTSYQTDEDLDVTPLTWTLASGEHYGRGAVEDTAVLFHKLDVTGEAVLELMAVICDVKFLIRPGSPLAVDSAGLAASPRGSYHVGNDGDVTVPELGKRGDLQVMLAQIDTWEAKLSKIFLLSNVRDAERVTAEEIRMIANELESSFGGLYSRLAVSWQEKEANKALQGVDLKSVLGGDLAGMFEVLVTTGIESLSREGQLDNLRMAIGDMQMLEAVPEELRGTIDPLRFARYVFSNRYVDINLFLKTQQQLQEEQEHELAMAGRLDAQAGAQEVATHAGKAAIDQSQSN